MPLPIAHGLIGAAIVAAGAPEANPRRIWRDLVLGAALAVAPDLDMLLTNILHWEKTWHRGATHSLVWAAAAGCLAALPKGSGRVRRSICFAAATVSHGLFDWLVSVKGGVALFWPFSAHRFAAGLYEYPDVLDFGYHSQGDTLVVSGIKRAVVISFWELLVTASLLLVVLLVRSRIARRMTAPVATPTHILGWPSSSPATGKAGHHDPSTKIEALRGKVRDSEKRAELNGPNQLRSQQEE